MPNATKLTGVTPGRWVLDPARSSVAIMNKSMWGLATIKGVFTRVEGEGEVLNGGTARGTLTIDANSVDTKKAKLDTHLRSADFFDVEKFPTFDFTATGVTPTGDASAKVNGRLTILGVSREVSFTAQASDVTAESVTLNAELPIDRSEFGMNWNQMGMIKDPTTVTITARFVRRAS